VSITSRKIRLGDAGPDGRLRLDGLARYLQDAATDDSDDAGYLTGPGTDNVWLVRETNVRAGAGRWPVLGDCVEVATWAGGIGRAWAIRRTELSIDGETAVEASARWVHLDDAGRPSRLSPEFIAIYAEAAGGRGATARIPPPEQPGPHAVHRQWAVRRSDLDIVGHVNNAAIWAAVVEVTDTSVATATVAHHGAVEATDEVDLCTETGEGGVRLWMIVGGDIRVTATFTPGIRPGRG
jgi:acyl-ACP thioesterase